MWTRYLIIVAVYVAFFAAVVLGIANSSAKAAQLIVISAAAAFWLGFSVYRVIVWIRTSETRPERASGYPHWLFRFVTEEPDDGREHPATIGQIETI